MTYQLIVKGPGWEYKSELSRLTPSFLLHYERLGPEGPLLLWPEFKFTSDIKDENRREAFHCFRAFLQEWASEYGAWTLTGGRRAPISSAFIEFKGRPSSPNQALPVPAGFDYNLAFPQTRSVVTPRQQLPAPSKRRMTDSPDESRRKRHAIGRNGSEYYNYQGAKEVRRMIPNLQFIELTYI